MILIPGLDSAYPPSLVQAQEAFRLGYKWWGFYIGGVSNTDPLNIWTPGQEAVLRAAGIRPVPIVIPSPPHPADPVIAATQAFNSAKAYGLTPKISVCYNGSHIPVTGPVWLPIPGLAPTAIGAGSAIQYGQTKILGLDVDVSLSTTDFPMDLGLVCDLEFNVSYSSQWYQAFQNTIHNLGATVTPPKPPLPPPPPPIKGITIPAKMSDVSVSCRATGWQDLYIIGEDNKLYHMWWDTKSWHIETLVNR